MILTSCSKGDEQTPRDTNQPLIGTWEHLLSGDHFSYLEVITFNSNKTGKIVDTNLEYRVTTTNTDNFTWSIIETNIRFDYGDGTWIDVPYYIIDDLLYIDWVDSGFTYHHK